MNVMGKFAGDYSVEWFEDEDGERYLHRCACTKDSDHNNIVYRCQNNETELLFSSIQIEKHMEALVNKK